MTRVQWIAEKNLEAESALDFYDFYDSFCEYFDRISFETYKRYCRDAYQSLFAVEEPKTKTTKNQDGMSVEMRASDIKTEADLIKFGRIDTDKWEAVELINEFWGNDENPHYLIKGKYKPKESEFQFPVLQPANVVIDEFVNVKKQPTDVTINVSDLHAPLHDEAAMDISIQIMKDIYPSNIIINGDALDLTDFSDKFLASIECRNQTQEGINVVAAYLGKIRQVCPESKIVFLEGNHSNRMRKAILKNVSSAIGLKRADNLEGYEALSIPNLLCLDSLNIEWQPYPEGEYWVNENLRFHHGESLNLNKIVDEVTHCEVMGHNHKHLLVSRTKHTYEGRKQVWVASFGCLCKTDGSVPSVKSKMDWQSGFGIIYHKGSFNQPVPVYIDNGVAVCNGNIYTSNGN